MSVLQKSSLTVDGNSVRMSMPFAKVDKENRLVSGYATLDNVDTQGDIVLAEASASAFARARGNIREMHQPLAVGKIVDFREDEFFDATANNGEGALYRGIFVTAYVSKGAEDTWEKVLDGTLTGFSIGGEIIEASNEFVKEAGRTIRFIKEYDLVELSLVDNPANQLANVFSIQKSSEGSFIKGMLADVKVENVFYCLDENCSTIVVNESETHDCPACGVKMENIGWFESGADRAEKVRGILAKFADKEAAPISQSEGGEDMGTEITKSEEVKPEEETEEVKPEGTEEAPVEVEEVSEGDETEKDESPEEVEDEATEISKKIDELHEAVKVGLEKNQEETLSKVAELEKTIADAREEFLSTTTELNKKVEGIVNNLETHKSRLAELEKNLEKVNSSDAIKKSADVESAGTHVQKETFWGNAFSGR